MQVFGWSMFTEMNKRVREMVDENRTDHIHFLDVSSVTDDRADAHPSSFSKSGDNTDCVHICSPGPYSVVNTWNQLLIEALERLKS